MIPGTRVDFCVCSLLNKPTVPKNGTHHTAAVDFASVVHVMKTKPTAPPKAFFARAGAAPRAVRSKQHVRYAKYHINNPIAYAPTFECTVQLHPHARPAGPAHSPQSRVSLLASSEAAYLGFGRPPRA